MKHRNKRRDTSASPVDTGEQNTSLNINCVNYVAEEFPENPLEECGFKPPPLLTSEVAVQQQVKDPGPNPDSRFGKNEFVVCPWTEGILSSYLQMKRAPGQR